MSEEARLEEMSEEFSAKVKRDLDERMRKANNMNEREVRTFKESQVVASFL